MKCKTCDKELTSVNIYVEQRWFLDLNPDGSRKGEPYPDQLAESYEHDAECPFCGDPVEIELMLDPL